MRAEKEREQETEIISFQSKAAKRRNKMEALQETKKSIGEDERRLHGQASILSAQQHPPAYRECVCVRDHYIKRRTKKAS